jgi:DNA repair protein SbcC/Rad50
VIKQIVLNNFRTHKYTQLKLDKGINTFIGSSRNGKTSILRGLYWLKNNRPLGISYISHWNLNKKGILIDPVYVSIEMDDGIIIKRERSKDDEGKEFNGYIIKYPGKKEKRFEALNGNVPDEVNQILNMSDVNIQKQLEQPFLLSGSAGEAARYFNGIIRLDIIDTILSAADSRHRKLISKNKDSEIEIENVKQELGKLEWINDAEILCNKCGNVEKMLNKNKEELETISTWEENIEYLQNQIDESEKIIKVEKVVQEIEQLHIELEIQKGEFDDLQKLIIGLNENNEKYILPFDEQEMEKILTDIEKVNAQYWDNKSVLIELELLQTEIEEQNVIIDCEVETIKKLQFRLPKECPLCGAPIHDGKYKGEK